MKNFTTELTTHKKILETNNSMCHNYYYLQYGRIYNADKTKFKKFKFVVWFDIFDVMEHFEKDVATKGEIAECANEFAWAFCEGHTDLIKSFDNCQEFYDWCNETIDNFNRFVRVT